MISISKTGEEKPNFFKSWLLIDAYTRWSVWMGKFKSKAFTKYVCWSVMPGIGTGRA